MKNDKNQRAMFELMKCGIWGTVPDLTIFKHITPADWLEIYQLAGKQTVLGICLRPVMDLPQTFQPPARLLMQWVGLHRYIEAKNLKKIQVCKNLNAKLSASGFTPVIFKGLSVAKWYPRPLSRQSSDIDMWIPGKFEELIQLLEKSGCEHDHKPQHDAILYEGIPIELHPKMITVPFQPSLKCAVTKEKVADNLVINTPDPNTTCLVLLAHAASHLLITGLGYRHLCDWAVYLKYNLQRIDEDLVLREAKQMGMEHFVIEFTKLAEVQLGLHFKGLDKWTRGSNEKYLSMLSDKLFEYGDFGSTNFQTKTTSFERIWHAQLKIFTFRYYWPKLFWTKGLSFLIENNWKILCYHLHLPR